MNVAPFKWVFVGGMIRSGSTLQYQILSELVANDLGGTSLGFKEATELDAYLEACEDNPETVFPCVVKSHVCTAGIRRRLEGGEAVAFYTYRDIRDVVVSGSRNFMVPIHDFISGRLIDEAIGEGYLWRSNPSVHASSFETLMADMGSWITGMMAHLGIAGERGDRISGLVEDFSIGRQKERLRNAAFDDVHGFAIDPATLLHKEHIDRAAIEGWRGVLSEEQLREVERRSSDWLCDNGYKSGLTDREFPSHGFLPALRTRMALYFQESDLILVEREELLKKQSAEGEMLRARLKEVGMALEKVENEPQTLSRWLFLQRRRMSRSKL